MASKLEQRDKELMNAHITKRVGQKPYEDGLWGSQGNRDFTYFEIYDSENNLIKFCFCFSSKIKNYLLSFIILINLKKNI